MNIEDIEDIEILHKIACDTNNPSYIDPETGFNVFTENYLHVNGTCCGSKCRHCPYDWKNVKNVSSKVNSDLSIKIKKIPPYTKTGDYGYTSLFNGERASKSNIIFDTLGAIDELNSFIGSAHTAFMESNNIKIIEYKNQMDVELKAVMSSLLDIGSHIATPMNNSTPNQRSLTTFDKNQIQHLEISINTMTDSLPHLTAFILPTGSEISSRFQIARTVCRRAERYIVEITHTDTSACDNNIAIYINRLSDYLFSSARLALYLEDIKELSYIRTNNNKRSIIE
ncbi:MAG: cob(I)yrinic acid a,c-diamide adenosyltransferase [Promethearchaeota archaeon]|jgi:cob(I)alamin adenosyltransferase